MEIKINNITKEELSDLITTALNGCNWLVTSTPDDFQYDLTQCIEDNFADILLNGKSIICTDIEEGKNYEINLNTIIEGLNKSYNICPFNFSKVILFDGTADYYDANNVWQVIMFGKTIYG